MTQTIDYQDGQPVDEILREQPNKIIAFSHGSYRTVGKICWIWEIPHKTRKNSNLEASED
jgi:hypothetical protein